MEYYLPPPPSEKLHYHWRCQLEVTGVTKIKERNLNTEKRASGAVV